MKILHLLYESKGDYFGIGGVGIRAYEIYKYLKDRHDITLLCKRYPGAADGDIDGLRHIFVGAESRSLTRTLLSYACHAALFVKKYGDEFDIIIEEFSPAIPSFSNVFTKKAVILQVQGYTGRLYFRKYNPFYALFLYSMEHIRPKFCDKFVFVASETAKKLSVGNSQCKETIPNGVSPDLFDMRHSDGDYILHLGRIDIYGKGLDILLAAYADFSEYFPHVKLLIAGDGRDTHRFKEMLAGLPEAIKKNIELTGWVSGSRKIALLMNAKFVVCPSRHETQGIVVLEAMAAGKALIVSDIPELGYATDSGAGISFKSGDAASLTQAMRSMAANESREEMGLRGRNRIKDLTWDKIALKFEKFLVAAAEKHP